MAVAEFSGAGGGDVNLVRLGELMGCPEGVDFVVCFAWRHLKAQFTSPAASLVDASGVTSAHEAGIKVLPWTVNDTKGWSKLIEAGVDGIITDDPEALLKFLGRAD
jgi:glycerophosphoryl diester phosphodiesterase